MSSASASSAAARDELIAELNELMPGYPSFGDKFVVCFEAAGICQAVCLRRVVSKENLAQRLIRELDQLGVPGVVLEDVEECLLEKGKKLDYILGSLALIYFSALDLDCSVSFRPRRSSFCAEMHGEKADRKRKVF